MQRLLYGKTLDEHINVDVIAKKLFEGLSRVPDVVFVDSKLLLEARRVCSAPIALLRKSADPGPNAPRLGEYTYEVPEGSGYDDLVAQAVAVLESRIRLCDPFERITEAVKEALRSKP